MKITKKQKAVRVLEFLMGLRNRRVQSLLRKFGLTQLVVSEGHRLLHEATDAELVAKVLTEDVKVIKALDEFENTWYPICQATLKRHAAEIGEWLFLNLVQTSGIDLVVGVKTFLSRYSELASGESKFGASGEEATSLLAKRGLTPEVIGKVQAVLEHVETFAPEDEPAEFDTEAAEEAMWQWYLEWSTIARTAVKDRRLLRALGFLKNTSSSGGQSDSDDEVEDEVEDDEAAEDDVEADVETEADEVTATAEPEVAARSAKAS